jgi:predicted ATPase/class 3 adenylate cyclase
VSVADTQRAVQGSPLPTGTVTLLFTDIEGSTQHWEERRTSMPEALRRHDELIRDAIEANGGYVFKTVGDAFCASFWRASDAVAAAADAQRALAAEDWSAVGGLTVRMALHSGATDERDGDYFGPVVNRVARLLAVVNGGQVVVSGATAQLLRGAMLEETELRDLGEHRLKDLVEPEHAWQLVAPGLLETFPALRSLESLPNNLPRQVTPLIGREEVLAEIEPLVYEHPLVTLVGTGGVGKTRVALQVGADLLDGSGDGVWLVELAVLTDPSLVAGTIASTLGVREQPERPVLETLLRYLKRKRLLLILDNCEHVVEEVAKIADAIMRGAPEVRVLATSRESLRIDGEHVYRMPSLTVPPQTEALTAEAAMQYGAVVLFAQRAAASDAKFKLTDESAPIVAEICRRLDGIALAIELAAARVKVLAPRQLAQKLDERFRVLIGGSRTALPRQQTMRALIDWSYDLLSAKEQKLFRRLAIFAGGWTLETASAVCVDEQTEDDAIESWEVLDLLSSLVDKSLVIAEPAGEQERYRLLESTREYARDRLQQSGEYDSLARAHAAAYLELTERVDGMIETASRQTLAVLIEPELENLRSAVGWALLSRGDMRLGESIAAALGSVVFGLLPAVERLRWVRMAIENAGEATPGAIRARLDLGEATLHSVFQQNELSAIAAKRALARYRELGDELGTARALCVLGEATIYVGDAVEAEDQLYAVLAIFRKLDARRGIARVLICLAEARLRAGDVDAARSFYDEHAAIAKTLGGKPVLGLLAEIEFSAGNVDAAFQISAEALDISRAYSPNFVSLVLVNMARYSIAVDRYGQAHAYAREALARAVHDDNLLVTLWALECLAAVSALLGLEKGKPASDARKSAARLISYVDARLVGSTRERVEPQRQQYDRAMTRLRAELGENELQRLMAEGASWTEEHAVAEGLAM